MRNVSSTLSLSGPDSGTERERSLRILFVATSKNHGGIEMHSVRMAERVAAEGLDVVFACSHGEIIENLCLDRNIATVPVRVKNSGDMGAAAQLGKLIAERRIDLVHVNSRRDFLPAVAGVEWARRLGAKNVRVILHMHMIRTLGDPAWLSGLFFAQRADAILAVCEAVRNHLLKVHPGIDDKLRVLHNGVDLAIFAVPGSADARSRRRRIRREWEIPDTAPVIGMVGRLDAKGQETLLRAASTIVSRCPRVHFVLVGSDGLDGQREKLMGLAKEMGIEDRVILPGLRDDVPDVMTAFDVLAHLPTDDALPGAPIEAMMAGLPVVATRIGGCPEIVRHGVTGRLVMPGDTEALVEALSDLLAGPDPAGRRKQFGDAGRRAAEEDFSLERQGKRLVNIYSELCRRPNYNLS